MKVNYNSFETAVKEALTTTCEYPVEVYVLILAEVTGECLCTSPLTPSTSIFLEEGQSILWRTSTWSRAELGYGDDTIEEAVDDVWIESHAEWIAELEGNEFYFDFLK